MNKPDSLNVQVGGNHYKGMAIEPAEYIHKNNIGFLAGSVIKYISRFAAKNGAEDIKKAIHFCCMILDMSYGVKATVSYTPAPETKNANVPPA